MKYITIQEETKSWWKSLFQPSVLKLMAYVESLEGLEFKAFHYVMSTDELDVTGTFQGYYFKIYMECGGEISLTFDSDVSEQTVSAIEQHLKAYKYVGIRVEKLAVERFQRLAKHGN
ncbi:hypothetical protein [Microbulbifer sp. SAOS-129_SWC]|uniref:hypothetical protein n=1 Tax=Microbulbifer sp. SAOS-129_SWC TaxID=3145235 RepID=UPI003216D552